MLILALVQLCSNRITAAFSISRYPQQTAPTTAVQPSFHDLSTAVDMDRVHCQSCDRRRIECWYVSFVLYAGAHLPDDRVLYGFSLAYLFAPGTFDSASIVEVVSGLPDAVKYTGKVLLAAPFAFHSLNGLRHLGWDMGKCMVHYFFTRPTH